jgi:hypothetical protein
MLLLSACAAIERGRSAPTSTDVRSEATFPSAPGSKVDNRVLRDDSIVNDLDEIGAGPKTERAIGIVGLVALIASLTLILIGFYKLGQAL